MIFYFVALSIAMLALGLSGIASSKNFLIMMLSVEVVITASTLLATAFFYYSVTNNILLFLIAMWSVASVEVIALVAFYRYLAKEEVSLDVTKLSKLKY